MKGIDLRKMGRLEEALEALDAAVKADPRDQESWRNRAVTLNLMGRHEEALGGLR